MPALWIRSANAGTGTSRNRQLGRGYHCFEMSSSHLEELPWRLDELEVLQRVPE